MRRHRDLGAIYGEAPEVSAAAANYVSRHFKVIADWLVDESTLMPSGFGLADILLMSCLDWAIAYEPLYRWHCRGIMNAITRACLSAREKINYPDLFGGDA